ncbi:hypothetical protein BpHYR1_038759, partial [Brachionus plicatilis]
MTEQIGYQNQHNNSNGQMPCSNIQNRNLPEPNLPQNNGNIIIADMQSQLNMIHTSTHQQISELREIMLGRQNLPSSPGSIQQQMREQIGYQNQHTNSNGQMPCSNIQNRNLP